MPTLWPSRGCSSVSVPVFVSCRRIVRMGPAPYPSIPGSGAPVDRGDGHRGRLLASPTKPSRSPVVALTSPRPAHRPSVSASFAWISRGTGRASGAPRITVASTLPIAPAALAEMGHDRAQEVERFASEALVGVREVLADVPSAAAPSRASITAWVRTSASEWPARPSSCGMSTPPRISGRPVANACVSIPRPVRDHHPMGSMRRSRRSNTHSSVTPASVSAATASS